LGKEVDTLKGADLSGLEAKIKQHIEVKDGEGSFLASGSKETVNGYPDITENIDVANVPHPLGYFNSRLNVSISKVIIVYATQLHLVWLISNLMLMNNFQFSLMYCLSDVISHLVSSTLQNLRYFIEMHISYSPS